MGWVVFALAIAIIIQHYRIERLTYRIERLERNERWRSPS